MQKCNPGKQLVYISFETYAIKICLTSKINDCSINTGTKTDLIVDECNRFKYLFFAIGASIKGWMYCTPVIVVDGTFLKSTYGGTLLTASAQNANRKIHPIAFAIVDSENDASWEWFMIKLKETCGEREGQCIISDKH